MESNFIGSIKLMPLVYGITIVISFMVAGIIKGLFATVSFQTARNRAGLVATDAPPSGQSKTEREG